MIIPAYKATLSNVYLDLPAAFMNDLSLGGRISAIAAASPKQNMIQ